MIDIFTDVKIIGAVKVSVNGIRDRSHGDRALKFTLRLARWEGPDRASWHALVGKNDRTIRGSRWLPGFLDISYQQGIVHKEKILVVQGLIGACTIKRNATDNNAVVIIMENEHECINRRWIKFERAGDGCAIGHSNGRIRGSSASDVGIVVAEIVGHIHVSVALIGALGNCITAGNAR